MEYPGFSSAQYDENGNLTCSTDPLGAQFRTQWLFARALPKRDIDAAGHVTEYTYDRFGSLVEVKDTTGTTHWRLDRYGQPLIQTAANGATRWNWNASGQVTSTVDCSENLTTFDYDRDGHPVSVTDALGQTSHYTHDKRIRRKVRVVWRSGATC